MILLRSYLQILHENHKMFWSVSYTNFFFENSSYYVYGRTVFPQI